MRFVFPDEGLPPRDLRQITLASGPTCSTTQCWVVGQRIDWLRCAGPFAGWPGPVRGQPAARAGGAAATAIMTWAGVASGGSRRLASGDGHQLMPAVFQPTYDAAPPSPVP